MTLQTPRLTLRPWKESDASALFQWARHPEIGPAAGWPPHHNQQESLDVIHHCFHGDECYAVCEKGSDTPIGCIELKTKSAFIENDSQRELGYWLARLFWGRGYMPEACQELLRHGFEDLRLTVIWCGYYEGNAKSARVQEKLGFQYYDTHENTPVPLLGEVRTEIVNRMTHSQWAGRSDN